jgi:lipopolysaccharide biosynthesis glycosyltransferase
LTHIAVAIDSAYAPWAATLIRSAIDATSSPLTFHLLTEDGFPVDDAERLARLVSDGASLIQHTIGRSDRPELRSVDRFGTVVWLRFMLPELLPGLDRILYLDADTFVVRDLSEVLKTDLDGSPIGAVSNVVEPSMRAHVASLGITRPGDFFNSGVLLMDLDLMRREGSSRALFRFAADNASRLVWPDQDALNVVFERRWQRLHPRWNAMNSLWTWEEWAIETFGADRVQQARTDPAILHFEGPALCKPWHYLSTHPWRNGYRSTLRRTPWSATPLEDRTWSTRAIGMLPAGWRIPAYWKLERRRRRRAGSFRRV